MTLTDLLTDLERLGVALEVDGAALRYKAPGPVPAALVDELKARKDELLAHLAAPAAPVLDLAALPTLPADTASLELVTWRLGFTGQTARRYPLASHPDLYARMLEHARTAVTPAGWEWAIVAHPAGELIATSYDAVESGQPGQPIDPHVTYGRNGSRITWASPRPTVAHKAVRITWGPR